MNNLFQNLKKVIYFLIFISSLLIFSAKAQQTQPKTENKTIPLFFEKVYLHTDRNLYYSGDDIWIKAYLVNAISHVLMETSANLYVDLINPDLQIIEHKLLYLDKGLGKGDFKLSDSIAGGTYKIRAYTNWMKNFGDNFIFEKEINIISTLDKKTTKSLYLNQQPTIQFFPESGSLIANALNYIAFKTTDEKGKGCKAHGTIVTEQGDTINWFNTLHNGMGSTAFIPEPDKKYYAVGFIKDNQPFKTELPAALKKGYGLQITDFDTSHFYVNIITNQETISENPNNIVVLNGLSHSRNIITQQLVINEPKVSIRVPKRNLKSGLIVFTLYDTLLRPQCQRLFYNSRNDQVKITVTTDKENYIPREKTVLTIKVTDNNGMPVKTNLSLAVTDTELSPESNSNMVSYFNLESEIRGEIENPWYYFDPANKNRNRHLDLLLLTQGWRDFLWRRIKDTTLTIMHMVEPGLSFTGRVRQKFADNPIPDVYVTLYAPEGFEGKLFSTKTHINGKYYFEGVKFYGEQKVMLNVSNAKGKGKGWIFLDNPIDITLPVVPFYQNMDILQNAKQYYASVSKQNDVLKPFRLTDTIQLAEVTVISDNIKEKKQDRQFIIDGGFIDYSFKIGPEDENMDIGTFLSMRVPGAYISNDPVEEGPVPYNRVLIRSMGKNEPPAFILDGFSYQKGNLSDENVIYNLSLADIDRIVVSRNDIRNGGPGSFVIGIFTKPGSSSRKDFYSINQKFNGYYQAREFYSPIYPNQNPVKPDLRTTIFWEPNISTDENGEYKINYFNNDKKKPVRIVLEGLTHNGTPLFSTQKYEVK